MFAFYMNIMSFSKSGFGHVFDFLSKKNSAGNDPQSLLGKHLRCEYLKRHPAEGKFSLVYNPEN